MTDEKKPVTLILRELPDYNERVRPGYHGFRCFERGPSSWEMQCPELGFSGGFYNSRERAIDEALMMMAEYAAPFTAGPDAPPEWAAARAALSNAPAPKYVLWNEANDPHARMRKLRERFSKVVKIVDGQPFSYQEVLGWRNNTRARLARAE